MRKKTFTLNKTQQDLVISCIKLPGYWMKLNSGFVTGMLKYVTEDDIKQELYISLLYSAHSFSSEVGCPFSSYAMKRMDLVKYQIAHNHKYGEEVQYTDEMFADDKILSYYEYKQFSSSNYDSDHERVESRLDADSLIKHIRSRIKAQSTLKIFDLFIQGYSQTQIREITKTSKQNVSNHFMKIKKIAKNTISDLETLKLADSMS